MARKLSEKFPGLAHNPVRRTLLFDDTRRHKLA
jgi:hypothetical protein